MSKRVDIMVDIETLGTGSDATIFQISAIAFDILTGEYFSTFNKIANISLNQGLNVDGDTLKWWLNTNKELLTDLLNKGRNSSEDLLIDFYDWLLSQSDDTQNIYFWGNGILFDNKMIQHQLVELGLGYPIFYKNDRDVRTLVDLAGAKLGLAEKQIKEFYNDDSLVEHDALDDVKYQIKIVVGCYKALIKPL
jgi:hypothetical protein